MYKRQQEPDPLITAKEAGEAPAYRGLAYVVFERFPLADYGNRVPQFDFEVVRAVDGLGGMIRAVALTPGAGEFVYDTRPVSHEPEPGVTESLTRHQLYSGNDADTALRYLPALCPNLRLSLIHDEMCIRDRPWRRRAGNAATLFAERCRKPAAGDVGAGCRAPPAAAHSFGRAAG